MLTCRNGEIAFSPETDFQGPLSLLNFSSSFPRGFSSRFDDHIYTDGPAISANNKAVAGVFPGNGRVFQRGSCISIARFRKFKIRVFWMNVKG